VIAVAAAEPGRFRERDAARLQDLADRSAPTLERARLGELERARKARVSFLDEAGDVLAGHQDCETIVALAVQLVVPQLADWCAVLLAGADGAQRPVYLSHVDESRADALAWLLEQAPPAALAGSTQDAAGRTDGAAGRTRMTGSTGDAAGRTRMAGQRWQPAAADPAAADPAAPPGAAQLAAAGAWCFPLTARSGSRGQLVVGAPAGGRLCAEVTELAEGLARRVAIALESAARRARQQFASRMRQPLPLPHPPLRIPGVELAVRLEEPDGASSPGGDFYDVFPVGADRWRFVIADVCGTGQCSSGSTSSSSTRASRRDS
jgi:hypothetical protein